MKIYDVLRYDGRNEKNERCYLWVATFRDRSDAERYQRHSPVPEQYEVMEMTAVEESLEVPEKVAGKYTNGSGV